MKESKPMGETADGMSRQAPTPEAYGRAVGDHDHSPRSIENYLSTKNFLPAIRAAVPNVTLLIIVTSSAACCHKRELHPSPRIAWEPRIGRKYPPGANIPASASNQSQGRPR